MSKQLQFLVKSWKFTKYFGKLFYFYTYACMHVFVCIKIVIILIIIVLSFDTESERIIQFKNKLTIVLLFIFCFLFLMDFNIKTKWINWNFSISFLRLMGKQNKIFSMYRRKKRKEKNTKRIEQIIVNYIFPVRVIYCFAVKYKANRYSFIYFFRI